MNTLISATTILLVLANSGYAQHEKTELPRFRSAEAKKAVEKFQRRNEELQEHLQKHIDDAKEELQADLESALKTAVEEKDFAEVQLISTFLQPPKRRPVKSPETKQPENPAPEHMRSAILLATNLEGSVWHDVKQPNFKWFFQKDGTVLDPPGKKIPWSPIDASRIALRFPNGSVDIVQFDPELKTMSYYLGPRAKDRPASVARREK